MNSRQAGGGDLSIATLSSAALRFIVFVVLTVLLEWFLFMMIVLSF
jgi:hypothetical protein